MSSSDSTKKIIVTIKKIKSRQFVLPETHLFLQKLVATSCNVNDRLAATISGC